MKRRMRKVTALVLSVGMMLSMTITSGAVTIDEAQKKADELQSQKSAAQAEKDTLAAKLNSIIDQMNKTQEELSAKETEISTAEEELVQAKVDEDDQYNSMKKRIKFMYEGGNTQFLEILMSSSNIGDLLNKAEYVSKLSSYDRDMLVAFQETVKAVEEKEAKLKDEYEKLNTLQTSLVRKHRLRRFRIRLQIMRTFLRTSRRKQKQQNVFRKSRQRRLLQLLRRQRRTIAEAAVVMEAVVPDRLPAETW